MTDHPITPPPELMQQWDTEGRHQDYCTVTEYVAHHAAQWSADQELEACCEWLIGWDTCEGERLASLLHKGRRPRPPSLKEQALNALDAVDSFGNEGDRDTLRRALEQIDD